MKTIFISHFFSKEFGNCQLAQILHIYFLVYQLYIVNILNINFHYSKKGSVFNTDLKKQAGLDHDRYLIII